jgi:hypothetical protein
MHLCIVKKVVVILALFMLLKPILPVFEYIVFYDYFKNELCENKENIELECNGKCHLTKELAKASDSPENGKEKRISVETNIVFYQEITETIISETFFDIHKEKIPSNYNLSYSFLEADSVFRPPIV